MGDENEEFSLFGDFDLSKSIKDFIKKNMPMIMILILLSILGSYFYMLSLGYGLMQIVFVYLGVGIVLVFLTKTIKKTMEDMKKSKKPGPKTKDELIKRRIQHQKDIDEIDRFLDMEEKKLKDEMKKIRAAKNGRVVKEKKK